MKKRETIICGIMIVFMILISGVLAETYDVKISAKSNSVEIVR